MADEKWEQTLLQELAQDYMKDKKRKHRWAIFFKTIIVLTSVVFVANLVFLNFSGPSIIDKPHVALIDVKGVISDSSKASADNIAGALRRAYKNKHMQGLILRVNSPGGSPVQASYAFNEIRRLKKLHPKIKVYAVCTDVCASAAYYIAAAADNIYADPSSIVGSIGVLYNGFGFVGAMDKFGVQRRLITAGTNKGFMDPFSPIDTNQKTRLKTMLSTVHKEFIDSVKQGRGTRLKNNPELFSGLFWTGRIAKSYGLIDDFGSPGSVARDVMKQEHLIDYTIRRNYLERIAQRIGGSITNQLLMHLGIGQTPISSVLK